MGLEEAKKILMSLPEYQDLVSKEYEAIDTVIRELVALQNLLNEYRYDFKKQEEMIDLIIDAWRQDDVRSKKEIKEYFKKKVGLE